MAIAGFDTIVGVFEKHPDEQYAKGMSFATALPSGVTITGRVGSAIDMLDKSDATSTVLVSGTGTGADPLVELEVTGGSHNSDYLISFRANCSNGSIFIAHLLMKVRDPTV